MGRVKVQECCLDYRILSYASAKIVPIQTGLQQGADEALNTNSLPAGLLEIEDLSSRGLLCCF